MTGLYTAFKVTTSKKTYFNEQAIYDWSGHGI